MQVRIVGLADVDEITQYNFYFDGPASEMGMVLYNVGRCEDAIENRCEPEVNMILLIDSYLKKCT